MPSKSFCSAAGKGLGSCRLPGRSAAYCSRKSAELLSCKKSSGGGSKNNSSGGGSKNNSSGGGSKNNTGGGSNTTPNGWQALETEGYYIKQDDQLDGYFIRDPNGVIHFVSNEEAEETTYYDPVTGKPTEKAKFDCVTGEPLQDPDDIYYDPVTGETIGGVKNQCEKCSCSCSH
jgi:hypothetical protein